MNDPATTYSGYVIAAYAVAFVLIGGLLLWTILSSRAARRDMAAVEAESIRVLRGNSVVRAPGGAGATS